MNTLDDLKARFQESGKNSATEHLEWVLKQIREDAEEGFSKMEVSPAACSRWSGEVDEICEDLRAMGFNAVATSDCGEVYFYVDGWASGDSTGRCREMHTVYAEGLIQAAKNASQVLPGVLERCREAATRHERRIIIPTPTRYFDTNYEYTPYSKALVRLLEQEGLTVIRHGVDSSSIRGWAD